VSKKKMEVGIATGLSRKVERRVSVAEEAGERRRKWWRRKEVVVISEIERRRGSGRRRLCRWDRCGGGW
jgi:hypothetical protein